MCNFVVRDIAFLTLTIGIVQAIRVNSTIGKRREDACIKCPSCLDPQGSCLKASDMVFQVLPECISNEDRIPQAQNPLCKRAMYMCPATGVLTSLPVFSDGEMNLLYTNYYTSQKRIESPHDARPMTQSADIVSHGALEMKTGLTILEIGCASGFVLYNLRHHAANGGSLICFEVDPSYFAELEHTFALIRRDTPTARTLLVKSLFHAGVVAAESVDVVTSSHVLEHISNPCTWLTEVKRILRPEGIVFTEIPIQYYDFRSTSPLAADFLNPDRERRRDYPGQFHVTLFGRLNVPDSYGQCPRVTSPFKNMMTLAGFEELWTAPAMQPNRYIFRKPMA